MITGPDNLFALPDVDALLREELARLPMHAAREPAGHALLVQACATNRGLSADTRHLRSVRVHVEQGGLRGDVSCAGEALPWESEAFRLVLVQHAGDVLSNPAGFIDEIERVLAPGGALLWYGLNPWSPWQAWIHWQTRRGLSTPRMVQADVVRRHLAKRQLMPAAAETIGTCWPHAGTRPLAWHASLLAPLRGAYLIVAAKQRSVLTPLRPHASRERAAIRPQLATPSRRARA